MQILHNLSASGISIIMATHNNQIIKKFPARTIKCEKGKVVETEQMTEIDFESLMD